MFQLSELIEHLQGTFNDFGDMPVMFQKMELDSLRDSFDFGDNYAVAEPVGYVTLAHGGTKSGFTCIITDGERGGEEISEEVGKTIQVGEPEDFAEAAAQ